MENLNKDNFWNDLEKKHPKAVAEFCKWIDKYKKRNDWNKLFNSDSDWQDVNGKNAPAPKFHDLPVAMQRGILDEFFNEWSETALKKPEADDVKFKGIIQNITSRFKAFDLYLTSKN